MERIRVDTVGRHRGLRFGLLLLPGDLVSKGVFGGTLPCFDPLFVLSK